MLYWQGIAYPRCSVDYQLLLDRAYYELSKNTSFRKALLSTGNAALAHSIGRKNKNETVLTVREFCSRLTKIREELQKEL